MVVKVGEVEDVFLDSLCVLIVKVSYLSVCDVIVLGIIFVICVLVLGFVIVLNIVIRLYINMINVMVV